MYGTPKSSHLLGSRWNQDFFSFKKTAEDLPGEANRFERQGHVWVTKGSPWPAVGVNGTEWDVDNIV